MTSGYRRKVGGTGLALGLLLLVGAASCGRSAPEGEAGPVDDGTEPASAGVRVTSETSVVSPSLTTIAPPTTPATSSTTAAPTGGSVYVVQAGDTLSVIATRFGITVDAISAANGIEDVNSIQPGQELIIPGG